MRHERLEALIGSAGLDLLRRRTVLVCGLGGVGSFAAEALARSGLGGLVLADDDVVEPTNLNRQLVALHSTIGLAKTDVMAARIRDIDPELAVVCRTVRITAENAAALLQGVDAVVDAIDDVAAKAALIGAAGAAGIPIVCALGFANRLRPELVREGLLADTAADPLAKALRIRLRKAGIGLDVPVVWSTEPPVAPQTPGVRLGSCAFVPSVAGLLLASHVIHHFIREVPS